jgi:hypothetical protein
MKPLFILICSLSISPLAGAKKFYTLSNGNWNNTTNVWSLDNTTPCGCFPGYSITSDTLTINHPLSLTGNVNSSSSGRIRVNSSGSISSTTADIIVNNSVVLSYGAVTVRSLNVGNGGLFSIQNASLIINSNLDNYGSLTLDKAALHLLNGNTNNFPGSILQLLNGSYIQSDQGNFKNESTIQVCSTCCLQLSKGTLTNTSTASFQGTGGVNLNNGIIKNFGTWSSTLKYCSSGNDQGMPNAENCPLANQICVVTNQPLPTYLISFDGQPIEKSNFLEWRTSSETYQEFYQLERSVDGNHWILLQSVPANGVSNEIADYDYVDSIAPATITYYRLTKYSENNIPLFSDQLSIKNSDDPGVIIFPNPSSSHVIIKCKQPHDYTTIELHNSTGSLIAQTTLINDEGTKIELPDKQGHYYIQLNGNSRTAVFTVVKY